MKLLLHAAVIAFVVLIDVLPGSLATASEKTEAAIEVSKGENIKGSDGFQNAWDEWHTSFEKAFRSNSLSNRTLSAMENLYLLHSLQERIENSQKTLNIPEPERIQLGQFRLEMLLKLFHEVGPAEKSTLLNLVLRHLRWKSESITPFVEAWIKAFNEGSGETRHQMQKMLNRSLLHPKYPQIIELIEQMR